jgi:protein tyrosine/serine phosphatase
MGEARQDAGPKGLWRVVGRLALLGAALTLLVGAGARPPEWAEPVALEGVPNLHRVAENLYRSAQPTPQGMKNLERLGIKTVINLRVFHSDRDALAGTSLRLEEVGVFTWDIDDADVVRVLRLASDSRNGPYLIHCQHGADRTGVVVALYRMLLQRWPREAALAELEEGGFGFHTFWTNIPEYVREADVEKLRAQIAQ